MHLFMSIYVCPFQLSQLINNLNDKELEYDYTQKNKFNNMDPNTNRLNRDSNFPNESYIPPSSNSPKQSHTVHSNLFEILQVFQRIFLEKLN